MMTRHIAHVLLAAGILLPTGASVSAAEGTRPSRPAVVPAQVRPSVRRPPAGMEDWAKYQKLPAFQVRLSLAGVVAPFGELASPATRQIGLGLLPQGVWGETPVGVAAAELTLAELMDAAAAAFGARWYFVRRPIWALAQSSRDAVETVNAWYEAEFGKNAPGLTPESRSASRLLSDLVDCLTPEQWQRLESGQRIRSNELAPEQWSLLRSAIQLKLRDSAGPDLKTPRPAALQGGVVLSMSFAPSDRYLDVAWPMANPEDDGIPGASLTLARDRDGRWYASGWPPDAPLEAPVPDAVPVRYRTDPKFNLRLELPAEAVRWEVLLQSLSKELGAPLVAQGAWLDEPVPFSLSGRSAAQLLDEIAALGRGEWRQVGSAWVLCPLDRTKEIAKR